MPKYLSQQEVILKCKREGKILFIEDTDVEKIKTIMTIAQADTDSAAFLAKHIPKQSTQWSSVYKLYYDALHELTESFLQFDKIKIDNHQCLFAYLCEKHPECELDWDFFEKIRTKRNGVHYYGKPISFEDWKEIELQVILYIKKLREEIKKRLENIIS